MNPLITLPHRLQTATDKSPVALIRNNRYIQPMRRAHFRGGAHYFYQLKKV